MVELKQALLDINNATGAKIDVLGFDACCMGMVEVAHQIKDYVDFMVGSEETEPNDGCPYDTILKSLANTSNMSASQLATTIVSKYMASYTDGLPNPEDAPTATQAAYKLAEETALATAISTFAQSLADDFNQYKNEIVSAKNQTELFQGEFIDLYDFTNEYETPLPTLQFNRLPITC